LFYPVIPVLNVRTIIKIVDGQKNDSFRMGAK